jgi:hypothetical protein
VFCDEEALLHNFKQARIEQREIAGSGQRIFTLLIPSEGWDDTSSRNCSVCELLLKGKTDIAIDSTPRIHYQEFNACFNASCFY